MPTWTDGWSFRSRRDQHICTPAEAREHLEAILSSHELVQWYSDMLDELNEDAPMTPYSLKELGYLNCRDEIMKTPLWHELSDEFKCHMLVADDESIRVMVGGAIDLLMCEYDETITRGDCDG